MNSSSMTRFCPRRLILECSLIKYKQQSSVNANKWAAAAAGIGRLLKGCTFVVSAF